MYTQDNTEPPRVVGYKAVQTNGYALWRSAYGGASTGGAAQWAMPGGSTSLPRALCNAAQQGHVGPGLHVAPTLAGATQYVGRQAASRVLALDADEGDVLYRDAHELRAHRWRTLAVVPLFDPRHLTADDRWFRDAGAAEGMHGVNHANRVQFWAWLIGGALAMSCPDVDFQALCWAAMLHDTGRVDDGRDLGHGQRSAEKAAQLVPYGVDRAKVAYLCEWHEPGHTANPPEWTPELLALQDADALDLHRCTTPDPARFHTDAARALNDYARQYAHTGVCPFFDLDVARSVTHHALPVLPAPPAPSTGLPTDGDGDARDARQGSHEANQVVQPT